jgi:hypothetical protein
MTALGIQNIAPLTAIATTEDDNERAEDHHEGHNGNDDGEHH